MNFHQTCKVILLTVAISASASQYKPASHLLADQQIVYKTIINNDDGGGYGKEASPTPNEYKQIVEYTKPVTEYRQVATTGGGYDKPIEYRSGTDDIDSGYKPHNTITMASDDGYGKSGGDGYKQDAYKYDDKKYPHQPYGFGYNIEDGYGNKQWRHEKSTDPHHVTGTYGYKDKNGIMREVEYIADKYGFRAMIKTNEPGTAAQDPAYVKMNADPVQVDYHPKQEYPSKKQMQYNPYQQQQHGYQPAYYQKKEPKYDDQSNNGGGGYEQEYSATNLAQNKYAGKDKSGHTHNSVASNNDKLLKYVDKKK